MLDLNLLNKKKGGGALTFKNARVLYPPADVTTEINYGIKITESPDGEILAIAGSTSKTAGVSANGVVYLYDAKTLDLLQTVAPPSNNSSQYFGCDVVFNKDRSKMYIAANGYINGSIVGRICIYNKAADGRSYTFSTHLVGTVAGGGFGEHVTLAEPDGFIFSGCMSVGGTYTAEGRVDKWSSVNNSRVSTTGYPSAAANDYFGRVTAYSESLGGVVFAGMPQTSGSAAKNGIVYTYSANAVAMGNVSVLPRQTSPSANVNFGFRMDLSPDGKTLAVVSSGYRKDNTAGGAPCGAVEVINFSRAGSVLSRTSVGFLELSDISTAGGNMHVKWIDNDNFVIGHLNAVVSGVASAGTIVQATRKNGAFEIVNRSTSPALPMPDSQTPVASRYLGASIGVGRANKRLYAGCVRDTNALGQPTGRVIIWDYE